jgi:hypothetical protein
VLRHFNRHFTPSLAAAQDGNADAPPSLTSSAPITSDNLSREDQLHVRSNPSPPPLPRNEALERVVISKPNALFRQDDGSDGSAISILRHRNSEDARLLLQRPRWPGIRQGAMMMPPSMIIATGMPSKSRERRYHSLLQTHLTQGTTQKT